MNQSVLVGWSWTSRKFFTERTSREVFHPYSFFHSFLQGPRRPKAFLHKVKLGLAGTLLQIAILVPSNYAVGIRLHFVRAGPLHLIKGCGHAVGLGSGAGTGA